MSDDTSGTQQRLRSLHDVYMQTRQEVEDQIRLGFLLDTVRLSQVVRAARGEGEASALSSAVGEMFKALDAFLAELRLAPREPWVVALVKELFAPPIDFAPGEEGARDAIVYVHVASAEQLDLLGEDTGDDHFDLVLEFVRSDLRKAIKAALLRPRADEMARLVSIASVAGAMGVDGPEVDEAGSLLSNYNALTNDPNPQFRALAKEDLAILTRDLRKKYKVTTEQYAPPRACQYHFMSPIRHRKDL
ncbi:MAG: hypothetical protein U0271_25345 [Polyangiaceae bacterium]